MDVAEVVVIMQTCIFIRSKVFLTWISIYNLKHLYEIPIGGLIKSNMVLILASFN